MTKAILIDKVAEVLSAKLGEKVSKKDSREILDGVVEVLSGELASPEGYETNEKTQKSKKVLTISGFGHFTVSNRNYKVFPGVPGTKKDTTSFTTVNRRNVSFRPAKALKLALNAPVA